MEVKHENSFAENYAAAGVDITAGYEAVRLMKEHVARTKTAGAIDDIGGFGGLFLPDFAGMKEPVLVSGTDGVGTKLKLAMLMNKHDTIGIDCVAMCVNDIICCGAKPLFFLDYIACGKNYPEKIAAIVEGVAEGCVQAGCALIGGETAEHPGMMPDEEYDVAGFAVGIVDRGGILRPETQKVGDALIALPSSGVHSNGFSLIRRVFMLDATDEEAAERLQRQYSWLDGEAIGDVLLTPTVIYVKPILSLLKHIPVKAVTHITGGGFYENIPRNLPSGVTAHIKREDVQAPPIFDLIGGTGSIPEREMFNVFNMGVGMVVTVAPDFVDVAVSLLESSGVDAYVLGELVRGDEGVIIEGVSK
ncbi:phosphoribosylformylglycinamidine cyclo-ligase [Candidatus Saccharibacteria bacterium]|nr:phosphoribosylformylglycinamidine cyclo-ligase [Candidatus Saccharibacteria bacterium]